MATDSDSLEYSPYSSQPNVIEISDEEGSVKPKVEFPVSPKIGNPSPTTELMSQISSLDNQLAAKQNISKYEVAYYQRKIEELEANSSHAFKYIAEIEAYVIKKISFLENSLLQIQANLKRASEEIERWKVVYVDLKNNVVTIPVPTPSSSYHFASHSPCHRGSSSSNPGPSSSK